MKNWMSKCLEESGDGYKLLAVPVSHPGTVGRYVPFCLLGLTPPAQFSSEALNTNAKHYAWKPCFSLTFPEKGIQKKVVYQQKVYPLHSSCVGSLVFLRSNAENVGHNVKPHDA